MYLKLGTADYASVEKIERIIDASDLSSLESVERVPDLTLIGQEAFTDAVGWLESLLQGVGAIFKPW